MTGNAPLAGLVLSGGFSTRMGRDKGALPWQDGLLVHHQARTLASLVPQVYISCRAEQKDDYSGPYPLIADTFPPGGPMSGLLSAMEALPDQAWLVLSVDMPYIGAAALQWIINHRNPQKLATVFRQTDGIVQPLVGIWEPQSFPVLLAAFNEQRYSLRRILEEGDALILDALPDTDWTNMNEVGRV
jgi:molybdopterin-guanine dinucleotide biosynthesis protein A